jgi:hypothetical protein
LSTGRTLSFNDHPGEIARRDPWNGGFMHLTLHAFDVARIDRSRLYLYQHFILRRNWHGNFLDMQIVQAASLIKL